MGRRSWQAFEPPTDHMAKAGFYTVPECRIRFGRDGSWYANDERITNVRIANLFSRHLRRQPDGSYALRIGNEIAPVIVEDTPFVIIGVGDLDGDRIPIELNDGTTELLDPRTLSVGESDVLYCRVKGDSERARFLRPAYYQLARYFVETASGCVALETRAGRFAIERSRGNRVW